MDDNYQENEKQKSRYERPFHIFFEGFHQGMYI